MIFNISPVCFGGQMRMGDIVACANVVEHFRTVENNNDIKFNITQAVKPWEYVTEFLSWMTVNTDYFSIHSGSVNLPWQRVNLWDYRDIAGDLVTIPNNKKQENKVVVVPLFDAEYNLYRNWPQEIYNNIIQECNDLYPDWDKVIVHKNLSAPNGWRSSYKLQESLDEIMTASVYYGGDTGISHFVGALANGPKPIYYTSSRGLLHTTPINWHTNKKGVMRTYWCDFENTQW